MTSSCHRCKRIIRTVSEASQHRGIFSSPEGLAGYMTRQNASLLMVAIMVCSSMLAVIATAPITAGEGRTSHETVPQFGAGFDETVMATRASDDLDVPRDLEFNPNVANELWVLNRADDSMTIIHNAGVAGQWSEHRQDAYGNHFQEEASALAFGQSHNEFGTIFATSQETRNTFNGQQSPNNFMGPALWPGSLSHYAVENQGGGGGLGSHLDMLHESPNGMGIAHDSGNAYWYFDGYYGELVYYDFHDDHDTGGEDHADGVVRRYSEISLTRQANIPGHMELDKTTGILYIADTGANRILWVNTDDTSTNSANIYSSNTRMETLAEYSEITGMEWGVLDSGLSRPSGIAIDGDTLFVSQNGNAKISAYDLATNGKSATHIQTVTTNANSIMGIDIGPGGKLWYVDAGMNRVIRLDPFPDADGDGIEDNADNCPNVDNPGQENHDLDAFGDLCDSDPDNDGVLGNDDDCTWGDIGWISSSSTDYDGDGCRDASEDGDDDEDTVPDSMDDCAKGQLGWLSDGSTDHDGDGCRDSSEDDDDDGDGICDSGGPMEGCIDGTPGYDRCELGRVGFRSNGATDRDRDGCEDAQEDLDDDDDSFVDIEDGCPNQFGTASEGVQIGCPDFDGDGWADLEDDYIIDPSQWRDTDEDGYGDNVSGTDGDACPTIPGGSIEDRLGCADSDEDGWSNPDVQWAVSQGADAFPMDSSQWADRDGDGYGDEADGYQADACPDQSGTSIHDLLGCIDSDGDGWSDANDLFPAEASQWADSDLDGYGDQTDGADGDDCPSLWGNSTLGLLGCLDTDGDDWANAAEPYPADGRLWSDTDGDAYADQAETNRSDDCPEVWGNSTEDRLGCVDGDGDGVSDENDFYPLDASRSEEEVASSSMMIVMVIGLVALIGAALVLALMLMRRKPDEAAMPTLDPFSMQQAAPAMPQFVPPAAVAGPPIPAEGIPPGWTMEQWQHYGEQWLRDSGRL
jgi:hypothetical protein